MQFLDFATTLEQIEKLSARLQITQRLAILWQQLKTIEIYPVANLLQGQLQPSYDSLEFGLSDKMLSQALAKINHEHEKHNSPAQTDLFGLSEPVSKSKFTKKLYRQLGDWGEVAAQIKKESKKTTRSYTIIEVFQQLKCLAKDGGEGSKERKINALANLLDQVSDLEAKFICRIILGKLRLGCNLMTFLDSLSWVMTGNKTESKTLEKLFQKKADLGLLAQSYLALAALSNSQRLAQLEKNYQVSWGVPLVPALCQRLNTSQEIIEKMKVVIAEPKYDGMRVQIHLQKKHGQIKVMAFTRSLENVSAMFPELTAIAKQLVFNEVIFDSEAVAYQPQTGKILPFQEMITRRRKHQIEQAARNTPLKFFIFDLLYLDGQQFLDTPLIKRQEKLRRLINRQLPQAALPPTITTSNPAVLHQFHQEQLALGLEGVVVKAERGLYQSGRKGWNWVKIKEEEGSQGKLKDTLDLVILGLYAGKGKRHSFGVGAFLVGCQNQEGEWVTLSKIGTGLTDEDFQQLKKRCLPLVIKQPPKNYRCDKSLTPDWWLPPVLVAEIAADEITKSNLHTSGFGLRFPRLVRWRLDKGAQQSTSLSEIITLQN